MVALAWRGPFASAEVEALYADGSAREPSFDWDWRDQVERHSLGRVCARDGERLVGRVNLAWDGAGHAFVLDTVVSPAYRRRRIARDLVLRAVDGARAAGGEWVHVDVEDHLTDFYLESCGFVATPTGVLRL